MLYQWKGIPRNREGVSVYSSFRRTEKTTGKVREFIVGDIVEVKSTGKGLGMVAQVVKFFQESDALTDVSDMRLSLRRLYRKKDFHHSMLRKAMGVMEERDNQVFFSDFLEEPGSNSIEVIENLVFLFQTETQRSDHVSQFTLGIKTRFIRPDPKLFIDCFFHHRLQAHPQTDARRAGQDVETSQRNGSLSGLRVQPSPHGRHEECATIYRTAG